jgi:multidrug resistance protein
LQQESIVQLLRRYPPLLVLCVATATIMLGQGVTGPVLPLYARSFGVSTATVGLTISAFAFSRLFLNIPVGILSDRFGRRVVLVGGPLIVCVGSVLSGMAGDIWQLLLWRVVAGVGSAMYMTGAAAYVTDIADTQNRARMLSLNQGSLLVGTSLGPVVGGVTAELLGLRAPFYVVGALSGLCGLWGVRSLPETRAAGAAPVEPGVAAATARSESWALLRSLPFLLVSMVTFSTFLTRTAGRQTIVPLLAADRLGLGAGSVGALFFLISVLNLVTVPTAGALADRLGRKAVIVPGGIATCVSLVMFALSDSIAFLIAAGAVHGLATGIAGPAPAAYAADIAPPRARGFAMGLQRTYGDLGFFLGPPLMGLIADHAGYDEALYANVAIVTVAIAAFGLWARETAGLRRPLAEAPAAHRAGGGP